MLLAVIGAAVGRIGAAGTFLRSADAFGARATSGGALGERGGSDAGGECVDQRGEDAAVNGARKTSFLATLSPAGTKRWFVECGHDAGNAWQTGGVGIAGLCKVVAGSRPVSRYVFRAITGRISREACTPA